MAVSVGNPGRLERRRPKIGLGWIAVEPLMDRDAVVAASHPSGHARWYRTYVQTVRPGQRHERASLRLELAFANGD